MGKGFRRPPLFPKKQNKNKPEKILKQNNKIPFPHSKIISGVICINYGGKVKRGMVKTPTGNKSEAYFPA